MLIQEENVVNVNLLNILTGSETPVNDISCLNFWFTQSLSFLDQIILYGVHFILFAAMFLVRRMVKVNLLSIYTGSKVFVNDISCLKFWFTQSLSFLDQIILYGVHFTLFAAMFLVRRMVKVNLLSISTGSKVFVNDISYLKFWFT